MNADLLSFISQSISTVVINVLFFMFFGKIYGTKYNKKYIYIIACVISIVCMIGINQWKNQYINMFYSYFSFNLWCILLYDSNIKRIWLHNTLFWFLLSGCDVITVLIWSVIGGNTLYEILSDNQLMLISNLLNILFSLTVYRIYVILLSKYNMHNIQVQQSVFMCTITFFEFFTVFAYSMEITNRSGGMKIILILIGFILINIYLTYIISQVSEAYHFKYKLSLAEALRELQLENFKEIEQRYRESRAIIHDIKKHMMVIDELRENSNDKAVKYSQHIYSQMDKLFGGFHCSNQILSIVLSQKISKAKSEGINVSVEADDVEIGFMDDLDITAIFANLWDNAIEACRKVKTNKYIKMEISKYNNFVIINFENSFDGIYLLNGKKLISTKKRHEGIGLSSIKTSVEKYDGTFETEMENKIFKAEITIPMPI